MGRDAKRAAVCWAAAARRHWGCCATCGAAQPCVSWRPSLQRHRVCTFHYHQESLELGGSTVRFCQQVGDVGRCAARMRRSATWPVVPSSCCRWPSTRATSQHEPSYLSVPDIIEMSMHPKQWSAVARALPLPRPMPPPPPAIPPYTHTSPHPPQPPPPTPPAVRSVPAAQRI